MSANNTLLPLARRFATLSQWKSSPVVSNLNNINTRGIRDIKDIKNSAKVEYDNWKIYKVLPEGRKTPLFVTVTYVENELHMLDVTNVMESAGKSMLYMDDAVKDGYPV